MRFQVDYSMHPAFRTFLNERGGSSALEGLFDEADLRVRAHVKSGADDSGFASKETSLFDASLGAEDGIEESFRPYVSASYERAIQRVLDEERRRERCGKGLTKASPEARSAGEALLDTGYAMFNMPKAQLTRLREVLRDDIARARDRGAKQPDDIAIMPPSNPEAQSIVNAFCASAGVFAALSAFYGDAFGSAGFVVHVSQPTDTWFHVFDDIGLNMPKTTQMHFDLDFAAPKSMLYLNDVGPGQGPFSLRAKAERFELFGLELAFRKEIAIGVHRYCREVKGKSTAGNTSIFRHVEARRAYASLPTRLRANSHQADHVLDGSALSDQLLASETRLAGEAGTMPVFTGSHVLHRGGLVTSGERIALQIVYYKMESQRGVRGLLSRAKVNLGKVARAAGVRK